MIQYELNPCSQQITELMVVSIRLQQIKFSFFVVLNGLGGDPQKHIYKQNIDHKGA